MLTLTDLSYAKLKTYQRLHRDHFPENLALRVHRALSWLARAEAARAAQDSDSAFIFYWISFNAAYANDFGQADRLPEQEHFQQFLAKICAYDTGEHLYELIWQQFSSSIRLLISNHFVYAPYWEFQRGRISEAEWLKRFAQSKEQTHNALANKNVPLALSHIFNRLYTLRNQLMHGGSTWNSQINRQQVNDASNLQSKLVPLIIGLMMNAPDQLWGEAIYPVITPS
ncbi:HEPN domain-containing protein [Rheinheimera sp. UJ63]|uniref:HEPN domain-containing protein n=1 Tax=Rheinheimera sp. UJ63 TaxID=2910157 RepID=UPI001EEB2471|nr:HEPN domain-containing protein [Rheinheimera sp. UJ63]MCF4009548.1 hypothetical protein [Rheinheimera sp. UJ63]